MENEAKSDLLSLDEIAKELNLSRGSISIWASVFQQIEPKAHSNGVDFYSRRDLAKFKEIHDIKNSMDCSIQMVKKIIDKKGFFADEELDLPQKTEQKDSRDQQDGFELLKYALTGGIISSREPTKNAGAPKKQKTKSQNKKSVNIHYFGDKPEQTSRSKANSKEQDNGAFGANPTLDAMLRNFLDQDSKIPKAITQRKEENITQLSSHDQDRITALLRKIENIISDLD